MLPMRALPTILAALTVACASPPVADPEGIETPVEVLDAGFVRFEGERCALEWFLLEMRERARNARVSDGELPLVLVRIRKGTPGVDGRWLNYLNAELLKAGIKYIKLEDA